MTQPLTKFSRRPLAEALEGVELSEPGAALLRDGDDAPALFERLAAANCAIDALKVAAAALPKREAVWMAVRCVRELHGAGAPAAQLAALDAADAWTADPTDANRRAANVASEKAGLEQAFGCVALAVYLSGGSLGPPDVPPIPPAESLCGVSCGLALEIALMGVPLAQRAQAASKCLDHARACATKPAPWDEKPASPAATAPRPAKR